MNIQHLDFEQARTKHLEFKYRLVSVLYGAPIDEQHILSHDECDLGKWIYAYGLAAYGHLPEMQQLEKVHNNFHTTIRQLVTLYQQGKVEEARQGLQTMEDIDQGINVLLSTIQEKVSNHENAPQGVLTSLSAPGDLMETLLDISLTGVILFQPVYAADGITIIDLAYVRLNLAAQQMLQLPERPVQTFLTLYPHTIETGIFAFYRDTFLSGQAGRYDINYSHDGLDNYFHLAALRSGQVLVVSFTDTSDHDRSAVEQALRKSQAREQIARAETETERQRLHTLFMQAPAAICILDGPDLVYELVNPGYQQLFPNRQLLGKPLLKALPELTDHLVWNTLQRVYQTGQTHIDQSVRIPLARDTDAPLEDIYFDYIFQARYNEKGYINGVLVFAFEVTGQMQAQQRAEQLNKELETARAQADLQRQQLHNIFMQAPALICIFEGPQHIFRLVNPPYQQLVGERPILGKPIAEAMPELIGQPIFELLNQVYQTGESFYAQEMLVQLDHDNAGKLGQNYYNFIYQAIRNLAGDIDSILVFAYEVTAQVQARQLIEQSRQQIQVLNQELVSVNEELLASNEELVGAKEALEQLNSELEERVVVRTQELKIAQAEAQRQRSRLERLFMEAPAAICILDGPEMVYELVNPGYQQLFPGRQLLGKPILEALPEIAGHTVYETFRQVYETGVTHQEQGLLIPLARPEDGVLEDRYFNYIQQARTDEQGRIDGLLVFAFEVTEQVLAGKEVEKIAQQLRLLTDALPASIVYVDAEKRYQFANRTALAWRQGKDDNILGRRIEEVVGELSYQLVGDYVERALFGEEVRFERQIDYPIGRRYIHSQLVPHRVDGVVQGFYGMVTDITEQVETRQEADLQRQRLHTLFMEASAPIVILEGEALVFQLVNPAYQQIFPGRALLGKALLEALPELEGTSILTILNKVYQTGETFVAQEMPLMLARHEGGPLQEIYFTFTYQARRNGQGVVDGVMAFAYEVTDQIKARRVVEISEQQAQAMAEELAAANEELRAANEEIQSTNEELGIANGQLMRTNVDLDNFIYTASHDLKAPIANIEGLMKSLVRHLPAASIAEEKTGKTIGYILESVERFKRTIENLTEVVKLQKENNQQASQVDLNRIVSEVQLDLESQIKEAAAHIVVDTAHCQQVDFSEKNLRSIIYNLLSNAIKYRSQERSLFVQIGCQQTAQYQILTVADNGLGMDLSREEKLFTMFRRLHDHVEGSGIGLYMVKKMIENAGGKIEVESKVGEGSTFRVYFKRLS